MIDYVPGYSDSLFICTGGSGHGFKFLPILGRVSRLVFDDVDDLPRFRANDTNSQHVRNQLEKRADQFTPLWKWRVAKSGENNNGLGEGEDGPRNLSNVEMAARECTYRPPGYGSFRHGC